MAEPRKGFTAVTVVCRLLLGTLLAGACTLAVFTAPAGAQTTHKFLEYWDVPVGSEPEPQAVDRDGNVYIYNGANNSVTKYDAYGTPVDFSELGTNVLDGSGGLNCPTVTTDCDRVPTGGFGQPWFGDTTKRVAIDNSNGPAAGYIYVLNNLGGPINNVFEEPDGVVEVFKPGGKFIGEIDESTVFPRSAIVGVNYNTHTELIVDRNGHIYVGGGSQINQFLPLDSNSAHDEFIGQLRIGFDSMAAGPTYTVVYGNRWYQYNQAAYSVQTDPNPVVRSSEGCPGFNGTEVIPPCGDLWEDGGINPEGNDYYRSVAVDPRNEDVYLMNQGTVEQWDKESTHQIGPRFGEPQKAGESMTFDVSGGSTDGRIYTRGGHNGFSSIAVFSPPVHVPDITYSPPALGHTSITVHADVSLDGGPEVTNCRVEYGLREALELPPVPCAEATPYTSDKEVSANLSGLVVEKDYYYRVRVVTANGTIFGEKEKAHTVAVLSATTDPATDIAPTTAVLHGKFDADSISTEYHFEYGLTSDYDLATPEVAVPASSGVIEVAPTELTQLQPGRKYHYALFASNELGTTQANDRTFIASGPPVIGGVRTTSVRETSADVHAQVNPLGVDTTYRFEFGLSPEYGSSVPVPDGQIPGGDAPQEVVAHLSDLEPGFTYHYRVVAANKWGTSYGHDTTFDYFAPSCPNSHVRQLTSSNQLPDCRAYELVSPEEANGVVLFPGSMTADPGFGGIFDLTSPDSPYRLSSSNRGYSSSPARLAFWGAQGALPGTDPPNTMIDMYVATRSDTGWHSVYPGVPGKESSGSGKPFCSDSMDRCIDYEINGFFHFLGPEENLPWVWSTDGNSHFIEKWPTNHASIPGAETFVGDQIPSGDFSHFVFSSRDLAFAPGGRSVAPGSAYDNDIEEKTVTIVSRLPGGGDIEQEVSDPSEFVQISRISPNGSHILMTTNSAEGPENVYMRVNDSVTYEVGIGIRIVGMTRSGDKIVFMSNNQLSPADTDSSSDVYMWNESDQSVSLLSKGAINGNSDDCNSTWTGKCGAIVPTTLRKDLDNAYAPESGDVIFYSPETLDPSKPGVPNQRNLYEWHSGDVHLIATLDPGTTVDRLQLSPDGGHAAFLTRASLTGYDNTSCDYEVQNGFQGFVNATECKQMEEMYSWDADRSLLTCVSCMRDGTPPTNDVLASGGGLFMADDGRTFFTTSDPLVPEDTDEIFDVYEYVDGRPQLISAGTGHSDVYSGGFFYPPQRTGLEGVSHTGVDVYFSTFDTLVPQDHNGNFVKFYDARTGGGFPLEAELLPCKAADECHGPGSEAPVDPQVSTDVDLAAAGNATGQGKKKAKRQRRRHRRKHRRHHGRHRPVTRQHGGRRHG